MISRSISLTLVTFIALSVLSIGQAPAIAQSLPESDVNFFQRVLDRILRDDEEDPPRGTRPINGICFIAPVKFMEAAETWHDRPTFVWQGSVGKIVVLDANETVLWEHSVAPGENSVRYEGDPLQAGQTYSWTIYEATNLESPQRFISFKVFSADRRLPIVSELESAAQRTNGTEEGIAIAHADYFTHSEPALRQDAIQSLFSVQAPSPELVDMQAAIIEDTCNE